MHRRDQALPANPARSELIHQYPRNQGYQSDDHHPEYCFHVLLFKMQEYRDPGLRSFFKIGIDINIIGFTLRTVWFD